LQKQFAKNKLQKNNLQKINYKKYKKINSSIILQQKYKYKLQKINSTIILQQKIQKNKFINNFTTKNTKK